MNDLNGLNLKALFGASHTSMKRGIFPLGSLAQSSEPLIFPFFTGWECISSKNETYDYDNRTRRDNHGRPFVFLQYTIRGTAFFDDGRTTTPVPAGQAILMAVPSPTRLYADTSRSPYEFLWVNMLGAAVHAWASDLTARHGHVFNLPRNTPTLACMARLHAMASTGTWKKSPDLALLENFRLTLHVPRDMQKTDEAVPLLDQARASILEQCCDPDFGVSALARQLNISRGHLARIFSAGTGRSPLQAIKEQRLQQAAILLAQGVPVHKVCIACGYRDAQYFRRDYRRQTGTSPEA